LRGLFKLPVGFFRLLRLPLAGFARLATGFCILTMRAASAFLAAGAAARSAMKLPSEIMLGPLPVSGWPIGLPLREADSRVQDSRPSHWHARLMRSRELRALAGSDPEPDNPAAHLRAEQAATEIL
jgi:hypothetical protein